MAESAYTIYISRSGDPRLNLAIEDWIYRNTGEDDSSLFLSCNDKSVVIGRFQNPWLECDLGKMIEDDVPLVRRQSGGGTVYHDPGNTNYSFICSKKLYDVDENYAVLLRALRSLGIEAERTERNDLYVYGKKFSGSAFKKTAAKTIHHGTLLHNADTVNLGAYLHSPVFTIEGKGIRSVPAKVINLSEIIAGIGHNDLVEAICREYGKTAGTAEEVKRRYLDEEEAWKFPGVRERYDEYTSWEWTFGKMPPFVQSMEWDNGGQHIAVMLESKHCRIDRISFRLQSELAEQDCLTELEKLLRGLPYRREAVGKALHEYFAGKDSFPPFLAQFSSWLIRQIYPS